VADDVQSQALVEGVRRFGKEDIMSQQRYAYDLACIGSGPAGQRAAVQAAKLGKRAVVIEKNRKVGGGCLFSGTIPSKAFREAVLTTSRQRGTLERKLLGPPEARPTATQLFAMLDEIMTREQQVIDDQLRRNDIDVVYGEASFKDSHTLTVRRENGAGEITAANVLIGVGTRPAPPPGAPADGEVIFTSDDVACLRTLPRTLTVVGGSVIGIEYASMFAALGIHVTVIDRRPRLLEFLDHEIVDELMHQMRDRNVVFRLGEAVESIEVAEGAPRRAVLHLESDKRIVADMVLFSVGRLPATGPLNLDAAGMKTDARGRLEVDASFRTGVPHIFAAGDVIGYPALAATSSEQGRLAVCHAFGVVAGPMAKHFPIGIYAVPEISMVGLPEHELTAAKVPYEVGVARYREIARGQLLGDDSGLFKMLFRRGNGQLLGIHAIGTGATELVHIGQAVLGLGGGIDYFLETVFNYPTLAECYKVAALNAANKLRA
jgi:NAD(P) transhydrogenase